MRRIPCIFLATAIAIVAFVAPSHALVESGSIALPDGPQDHITDEQRDEIWRSIDASLLRLNLPKNGARPSFRWPLRAARGYADPGLDRVSNYVDHDADFPGKIRDFNCGTRSYDRDNGYNHKGIDISILPDSWNVMAAQQLEIVAAAAGTIAFKSDGNFDRNCQFDAGTWNAVYVQHDDGSIAWYGHMKSGSLTPKGVGERVAQGEYLGSVGSSGNSTGPHLHLEVYDAARRLVDPFAGSCNAMNSESWWAEQPGYHVTRVNRAFLASAQPIFGTCGADGRLADPGTLNEIRAIAPGDSVYFVASVRDIQPGQAVTYTVRRPDGSVWRTIAGSAATVFSSGSLRWAVTSIEAGAPEGTWLFEAELTGTMAQAPFTLSASRTAAANYTDLWWNPAESGWGMNLVHQGTKLFATWFTYDTDRQGLWLVMSDATRQPDGSFTGTIYRASGIPFDQVNGQVAAHFPLPVVGTGTLRFASPTQATFSYTVNGVGQQKAMVRQAFSTPAACMFTAGARAYATNYQDLWWNANEPGWGVNIAHQGETIFATWFTYGTGGRGQWFVGSDIRRQLTGEYRGRLYRTSGTPFDQINGSPAVTASGLTDVGQVAFTFTGGEAGRMDYVVDGVSQSKAISRQVFAAPATLCR